jgi:hypothetical protein
MATAVSNPMAETASQQVYTDNNAALEGATNHDQTEAADEILLVSSSVGLLGMFLTLLVF